MKSLTKNNNSLLLAAFALMIASPNQGWSAASRIAFQDASAIARGNAFTATADNASAVFYNAAGLTQIEGSEVRVSAFAFSTEYEYSSALGNASADDDAQIVPSFYAAHHLEGTDFTLGFGVYAPFALGVDWGATAPFAPLAYEAELSYVKFHPVLAWKVTDTLSIGFGPSFDTADVELFTTGALGDFEGDDDTFGYSISILWQPSKEHSFGLNYQAKTKMDFEGTSTSPILGLGGPAVVNLDFPESIVAGYSWRPSEKWNFEVNVDWTNWDRVNSIILTNTQTSGAVEIPLGWESAFIYEAGVTRYFENGWNCSLGYTFVENAVPDLNYLPVVPDANRNFFSFGVGRQYESLSWQLVYQVSSDEEREVSSFGGFPPDGEYDLDSQALAFSIAYSF